MKIAVLFFVAIACLLLFGALCVSSAMYTSKYIVYENTQTGISAAVSFALALAFAFLFVDTIRDINKC